MARTAMIGAFAGMAAGIASGQGELQRIERGIEVRALAVAPAAMTELGLRRVGEWVAPGGGERAHGLELAFDCIRATGDCDNSYWFFGTDYCNVFLTNDMTVASGVDRLYDGGAQVAEFGWYWTCGGSGSERCILGIFTQESIPCEADSFDYSGWLLDFGTLGCNPGGYYFTNADIDSVGGWPMPADDDGDGQGEGSYTVVFARDLTSGGALVLATCAQPLLWGTGDARGDACAPGTQGPLEFADANGDGVHTPDECVDYSLGVCPDPLGPAIGFWADYFVACDINNDGVVDTRDVSSYLTLWASGSLDADSNGDGRVDSRDVLHYLNRWTCCRE